MKQYKLVYLQPYEVDNDSPSGIGDHSIQHARQEVVIRANTDKSALLMVDEFILHGSVVFNHYLDGDGKEYIRKPVEFTTTRVVQRWSNGHTH